MQLLKIGNRIINPEKITHVAYTQALDDPSPNHPQGRIHRQCDISFERDSYEIFYDDEADLVWAYLSASMHCRNLTPRSEAAA